MTLGCSLLLLSLLGCGGGGGGDDASDPVNTVLPTENTAATFVPDFSGTGSNSIWLGGPQTSGNLVTLKVFVRETDNVYAGSFDVNFDWTRVAFVGHSPGDLLERAGHQVLYTVDESTGTLTVGASRVGSAVGADITGPKVLIELTFRLTRAGSSTARFANANLLRPGSGAPEPIPGLSWYGGRFNAN